MPESLRKRFLTQLGAKSSFTFSEAKSWYAANKQGTQPAYAANTYTSLIYPLLAEGLIIKGMRGLYLLTGVEGLIPPKPILELKESDEFDKYLVEKGVSWIPDNQPESPGGDTGTVEMTSTEGGRHEGTR